MAGYITVISTAGSEEEARKVSSALVEQKLAACVQTFPISSCYSWEGKINTDQEHMLLIKTREALFSKVEAAIKAVHSYATPEIISLPIVAGSREYLSWIDTVTGEP